MRWRIYYDDGRIYANDGTEDIRPLDRVGVISIAEEDRDHNWVFHFGKDWYVLLTNGHWTGMDQAGLQDAVLFRLESLLLVLQGRSVAPHEAYQDVIDRMIQDCRPAKTGWHANERT